MVVLAVAAFFDGRWLPRRAVHRRDVEAPPRIALAPAARLQRGSGRRSGRRARRGRVRARRWNGDLSAAPKRRRRARALFVRARQRCRLCRPRLRFRGALQCIDRGVRSRPGSSEPRARNETQRVVRLLEAERRRANGTQHERVLALIPALIPRPLEGRTQQMGKRVVPVTIMRSSFFKCSSQIFAFATGSNSNVFFAPAAPPPPPAAFLPPPPMSFDATLVFRR